MSAPLAARLLRTTAELEALEDRWWALWRRTPGATPFQSPAWLLPWWRAFHPGELLCVAVEHNSLLVGLAPLYVERGARTRILPLGIGVSDVLDVLAEAELSMAVLAAIAAEVARSGVAWDEWQLPDLAPGATAAGMPPPEGCRVRVHAGDTFPVLALGGPDPLAAVPAGMRRKLRMSRHRVARHGQARLLTTADRDPAWWIAELSRLHAARWTARGEPGVLADPRLTEHHRAAIACLAAHGLARLFALQLGEAAAGVYYGFGAGERAYAYLGGFDPAFAYYSPGTFLIGAAIAAAAGGGARELHFLRGGEAYKYAWGARDRFATCRVLTRCPP